jgi:DnaJ-class molecular chaperone
MSASCSLYDVLELRHDCSQQEVKAAYLRMARLVHPDKSNEHDAKQQFGNVNEAYQVLSDADQRRAYDLSLHTPDARARAEAVSQTGRAASIRTSAAVGVASWPTWMRWRGGRVCSRARSAL